MPNWFWDRSWTYRRSIAAIRDDVSSVVIAASAARMDHQVIDAQEQGTLNLFTE